MKLTGRHCRCAGCGEYFNSETAFDAHRTGQWSNRAVGRRCLTVHEMTARGMSRNAAGYWISEPYVERRAATHHSAGSGDRLQAVREAGVTQAGLGMPVSGHPRTVTP